MLVKQFLHAGEPVETRLGLIPELGEPETPVEGELDLRFDTSLKTSGMCDTPLHGDLDLADALVVAPGEPWRSVLVERIGTRDVNGMPPLGTLVVDEAGVDRVTTWVEQLASCP